MPPTPYNGFRGSLAQAAAVEIYAAHARVR